MISIIVPVYNSEKTLYRCVDSLLRQTEKDIEVVLVVDGATDGSRTISEEYAHKDTRVQAVYQENAGVSAARNNGIAHARGEYIMFVDSDDYIEANTCERMKKTMEEGGADLVIAGFHHWYLGRDVRKAPDMEGTFEISEFRTQYLRLYETGFLNMPWNKLFRRELIRDRFPEDMNLGEDMVFNMSYMTGIQRVAVTKELFCNYIQENSGRTLSSEKRDDSFEIAQKVCEMAKEYYRRLYGEQADVRRINAKFVREILDQVEGLAFDKSYVRDEKMQIIRRYSCNPYMQNINAPYLTADGNATIVRHAGRNNKIPLPGTDYKIINYYFRRGYIKVTYNLIMLRKLAVIVMRKLRG